MANKKLGKFMNLLGFDDGSEEEYSQEEERPEEYQNQRSDRRYGQNANTTPSTSTYTPSYATAMRPAPVRRVVNMPGQNEGIRMVVLQPQSYEDTQTVIDNLKSGKPVVLNLESLHVEAAQRVLDFISGAIYAVDGNIRKVSKGIFLMAPNGIDITGNITSGITGNNFKRTETYSSNSNYTRRND